MGSLKAEKDTPTQHHTRTHTHTHTEDFQSLTSLGPETLLAGGESRAGLAVLWGGANFISGPCTPRRSWAPRPLPMSQAWRWAGAWGLEQLFPIVTTPAVPAVPTAQGAHEALPWAVLIPLPSNEDVITALSEGPRG